MERIFVTGTPTTVEEIEASSDIPTDKLEKITSEFRESFLPESGRFVTYFWDNTDKDENLHHFRVYFMKDANADLSEVDRGSIKTLNNTTDGSISVSSLFRRAHFDKKEGAIFQVGNKNARGEHSIYLPGTTLNPELSTNHLKTIVQILGCKFKAIPNDGYLLKFDPKAYKATEIEASTRQLDAARKKSLMAALVQKKLYRVELD